MLTTLALFAAALPTQAAGKAPKSQPPPPGLIAVKGGRTKIGTKVPAAEEMVAKGASITNLSAETPQHEVQVADFFLMATEVTCEQYAAFVRATGYRPPEDWAAEAIDKASNEYLVKIGEEKKKAKEEGRTAPEFDKFVRSRWWRENWKGQPWSVPKDAATRPVVYVDYTDALAYARWAGLRLPTEFEFQRAGRGDGENVFPWGNEADPTRAAVQELRINGKEVRPSAPMPVASFAQGAVNGFYDLAGNVWEWTQSPFVAYPGWKMLKVTTGQGAQKRQLDGVVDWRADLRVVVGGSFDNPYFAARLTARRPTDPMQSTGGMGFRCAASVDPGVDVATLMMRDDLPPGTRPQDVEFDVKRVVPLEFWSSSQGTATVADAKGQKSAVPGYAVIEGYDHVLYVPSDKVETITADRLTELSHRNGTVTLGVLSTTKPLTWPVLEKGTYVVSFRGAGEPVKTFAEEQKEKREDGKPAEASETKPKEPKQDDSIGLGYPPPPELPKDVAYLIFFTPEGQAKAWIPAPNISYANLTAPKVTIADVPRQYQVKDENGKIEIKSEDSTKLSLQVMSGVQTSMKGVAYTLDLYFAPGTVSNNWRHP